MKSVIILSVIIGACLANTESELRFINQCPYTIWPGLLGNPGQPENGGFELPAFTAKSVNVPKAWSGQIWVRTGCDANGRCQTGDCGKGIQCNGSRGTPPVTLVEMTLSGYGGLDYYVISLLDGYNVPVQMFPVSNFKYDDYSKYDCGTAGCHVGVDLNAICPPELVVKSGNATIACNSACLKFNTDQYCCQGDYGRPTTCESSQWPVNYPAIYKQACPDAYSYVFDDETSTFTCRGDPATDYKLFFCP